MYDYLCILEVFKDRYAVLLNNNIVNKVLRFICIVYLDLET